MNLYQIIVYPEISKYFFSSSIILKSKYFFLDLLKIILRRLMDRSQIDFIKTRGCFDMTLDTDMKAKKLKKRCIVFVGLTRVGKSTCYNWVSRKVLKGVDKDGRIIYNLVSEDGAPIAPGQLSLTLVFNEEEYDE